MKKLVGYLQYVTLMVIALLGVVGTSFATFDPTATGTAASVTAVTTDIVAWGGVLIAIALAILGFRKVKSIIR